MVTKKSNRLTLRDRLSRLTYTQACQLLGEDGKRVIAEGGKRGIEDLEEAFYLGDDLFRLNVEDAIVTITLMAERRDRLHFHCDQCSTVCEHIGAAVSVILEEKLLLGLSKPPEERVPVESLSDDELVARALEDRRVRSVEERMKVRSLEPDVLWTDYLVTNPESGKTYRVALRGWERGESFCTCPDYRTNTLGTCKHILHVAQKAARRFDAATRGKPYRRNRIAVHLHYGHELELRVLTPEKTPPEIQRILKPVSNGHVGDIHRLLQAVRKIGNLGEEVLIYPDAEEYMQQRLQQEHLASVCAEIRRKPKTHPWRKELLKTELLPYQMDGVAFAAGAGRAILADDMGLGKTIQGIGVAEVLRREAGISRVLIVCPTSLKSQWRSEIRRFSDHDAHLIVGPAKERAAQYANDHFFTVCNYEQVLRDLIHIEKQPWDLIILDEAQRIKNWEAKTSRTIRSLKSRYALALTGTPLENRLEELFTVVGFVDDRRLGPAFRFLNRHRVIDEKGRTLGYKNLDELREKLSPILLRRTREQVMTQLPPRTTEIIRIPPTDEQFGINKTQMHVISSIVRKAYLTEVDLMRLQKALLICRMAADSTFLVTKAEPAYSSKLEELDALLTRLAAETGRKIVLFSEWTTMLGLIEPILKRLGMDYVRLDGSVPQKKRQSLVNRFQKDPDCKVFITTNAGSTGLNLQAADTVINVDLPWNPAVLEQRIARAHRMGQKRPVQVYLLVTEQTIEENMLMTISAKKELYLAALDTESDVDEVDLTSGIEELKRRLEILLGAKPEAALDESELAAAESEAARVAKKERVEAAGGQLLGAAFTLLGELLPEPAEEIKARSAAIAEELKEQFSRCLEKDESGRLRLSVVLQDESGIDALANSVAALLSLKKAG